MTTPNQPTRRAGTTTLLALLTLACFGQKEVNAKLEWTNTITVVPSKLQNGKHELPAHQVSIWETDASGAMDIWKNDFKSISTKISGSKPAKAEGVVIGDLSEAPLLVLVSTITEKKAGLARLTVAYTLNDSTPLPDCSGCADHARSLGVKYNRAVVEAQVKAQESFANKAAGDLGSAQKDKAKVDSRLSKAKSDLEKHKARMAKLQRDNAKIQGDIAGLEAKFQLSNDQKDLQRLTKARSKLASGESQLAKQMQTETKLQASINKLSNEQTSAESKQDTQKGSNEQAQRKLDALRRKLDQIR